MSSLQLTFGLRVSKLWKSFTLGSTIVNSCSTTVRQRRDERVIRPLPSPQALSSLSLSALHLPSLPPSFPSSAFFPFPPFTFLPPSLPSPLSPSYSFSSLLPFLFYSLPLSSREASFPNHMQGSINVIYPVHMQH